MSPQLILKLLSRGTTLVFYFFLLLGTLWIFFLFVSIISDGQYYLFGWKPEYNVPQLTLPVKGPQMASLPVYSADSSVKYMEIKGAYRVSVQPRSAVGYYTLIASLISLGLTLLILKTFMHIFRYVKVEYPFGCKVVSQLRQLAFLFMLAGGCHVANYFIFSAFVSQSFTTLKVQFDFPGVIGGNITIGIIIYIIAIIFQRGIELQEENALAV